jgi:hypothetical protein
VRVRPARRNDDAALKRRDRDVHQKLAQRVVAALQELACDREASAVAANPLLRGEVVLAVGTALAASILSL